MDHKKISNEHRFVIVFTATNVVIAAAHLLPPSARFFMLERAYLAAARIIQGPLELLAFSILKINNSLSPTLLFLSISILAAVTAYFCWRIRFGNDVLPSLIFIYVCFGLASVFAGNILVSPSTTCEIEISATVIQEVFVFDEYGWNPGTYYFLLECNPSNNTWQQVEWVRLAQSISNPCESVNSIFHIGQ